MSIFSSTNFFPKKSFWFQPGVFFKKGKDSSRCWVCLLIVVWRWPTYTPPHPRAKRMAGRNRKNHQNEKENHLNQTSMTLGFQPFKNSRVKIYRHPRLRVQGTAWCLEAKLPQLHSLGNTPGVGRKSGLKICHLDTFEAIKMVL